ncbi:MAG: hypothetical protein ABI862_06170 [Ilumatobacteraceae bacterium]
MLFGRLVSQVGHDGRIGMLLTNDTIELTFQGNVGFAERGGYPHVLWMNGEVQAGELERRRAIAVVESLVQEIVDSSLDPAIPVPEYETLVDAIRNLQSEVTAMRVESGLSSARRSTLRTALTAIASARGAVAVNVLSSALWEGHAERLMRLFRFL